MWWSAVKGSSKETKHKTLSYKSILIPALQIALTILYSRAGGYQWDLISFSFPLHVSQLEEQVSRLQREKNDLQSRLEEDQEDMNELMKKHKAAVAQVPHRLLSHFPH